MAKRKLRTGLPEQEYTVATPEEVERRNVFRRQELVERTALGQQKGKTFFGAKKRTMTPEQAARRSAYAGDTARDADFYAESLPPTVQQERVAAQTGMRLNRGMQTEAEKTAAEAEKTAAEHAHQTEMQAGEIAGKQKLQDTSFEGTGELIKTQSTATQAEATTVGNITAMLDKLRAANEIAFDDNSTENQMKKAEQANTFVKDLRRIDADITKELAQQQQDFEVTNKQIDFEHGQGNMVTRARLIESQMTLLHDQKMMLTEHLANLDEVQAQADNERSQGNAILANKLDRIVLQQRSKINQRINENENKQRRWEAKYARKTMREERNAGHDFAKEMAAMNVGVQQENREAGYEQERTMADKEAAHGRAFQDATLDFQREEMAHQRSLPPTPQQEVERAAADITLGELSDRNALYDAGVRDVDMDLITPIQDVANDFRNPGSIFGGAEKSKSTAMSVINKYNILVNGQDGNRWAAWFRGQPQWAQFVDKVNRWGLVTGNTNTPPVAQQAVPPTAQAVEKPLVGPNSKFSAFVPWTR